MVKRLPVPAYGTEVFLAGERDQVLTDVAAGAIVARRIAGVYLQAVLADRR